MVIINPQTKDRAGSTKFGLCIPTYGEKTSVEGPWPVALEAQKMGYDSVWTTDHVLMPTESRTSYERTFESITTLAYLAALTSTVKLGVSSLIVAMHNPVVVIKQLATIDHLSQGRVMLAIGAGWNEMEVTHLGSNFHNPGRRVNDSIRHLGSYETAQLNSKERKFRTDSGTQSSSPDRFKRSSQSGPPASVAQL